MARIRILDKEFDKNIPYERIEAAVRDMSARIYDDYQGRQPLFLCVLNGAFMFAADLFKHYPDPCEISFIKLSSYRDTQSTGEVKTLIGLDKDIGGREVIILEDIVDTGITVAHLVEDLTRYQPASIRLATLLLKPDAVQTDVKPDYVGLEIPNDFIVGYGLDYNGFGRNYKDIYKITDQS